MRWLVRAGRPECRWLILAARQGSDQDRAVRALRAGARERRLDQAIHRISAATGVRAPPLPEGPASTQSFGGGLPASASSALDARVTRVRARRESECTPLLAQRSSAAQPLPHCVRHTGFGGTPPHSAIVAREVATSHFASTPGTEHSPWSPQVAMHTPQRHDSPAALGVGLACRKPVRLALILRASRRVVAARSHHARDHRHRQNFALSSHTSSLDVCDSDSDVTIWPK